MEDCIFCKIAEGKIPADKIYENDSFFSIPDANPVVDGHSLVISKKHFKTFLDMPDSLSPELSDCIKKTAMKLLDKTKAQGFNVVNNNFKAAGQVIKHVHFHIIPRKEREKINLPI